MDYKNIKEIIERFKNNKSVLITFIISSNQEYRLNIKFTLECINHLFGISKNYLYEKTNLYKIQNNNFNIEKIIKEIQNDRTIKKKNKSIIFNKINSFNEIFTKIVLDPNMNEVEIYRDLYFEKYYASYCFQYNNHVVAIKTNKTIKNIDHTFYNCHFLSIRTKPLLDNNNKINYESIKIKILGK